MEHEPRGRGAEVAAFLVDLERYHDRYLMFRAAAQHLDRLTLFTARLPPGRSAAELSDERLRVQPIGPGDQRGLSAQVRLLAQVQALERRRPLGLLHDSLSFLLPLFAALRVRPGRRPLLMSSLFTANYEWFTTLRKRWPYRGPLPLNRHYWRTQATEAASARLADHWTHFGEGHRAPFAKLYGLPLERVHSLPNCVDPAVFAPCAPSWPSPDLGPGHRLLLYVGIVYAHKGVFELLRAFARIAPDFPDARLALVGPGHPDELAALRTEARGLGLAERALVLGPAPRATLPGLLAAAELFVFPSYLEGSPRALIEAMACGRCAVTTPLPGVEALDPERRFFYWAERADVPSLARALAQALDDPAATRARGEAARAHFLRAHTPAAAGAALAALYLRLLHPAAAAPGAAPPEAPWAC